MRRVPAEGPKATGTVAVDKEKKEGGRFHLSAVAVLASVGVAMVLTTFMGLAVGVYLDRRFDTMPLFMIVFLICGIAGGIKNAYQIMRKYGFKD